MAAKEFVHSMLARIIDDDRVGLHTIVVAADLIAADARASIWFLGMKRKPDPDEKMNPDELLEHLERTDIFEECAAAVKAYRSNRDANAFNHTLVSLTERLKQAIADRR